MAMNAYRGWFVIGGRLYPPESRTAPLPRYGLTLAQCRGRHTPPAPDCTCGVYVFPEPHLVKQYLLLRYAIDTTTARTAPDDVAITAGTAAGPILPDPQMAAWRASRARRYQATTIYTDDSDVVGNYAVPCLPWAQFHA